MLQVAMSRPHPHSSVPARRFRTDTEGNIPLARDWFGLLNQTRRFDRVVIQTRNTCVRLITLGSAPALAWSLGCGLARDDRSGLTLRPSRLGQALGRLAHCTCCGSAGNIRFFDMTGVECIQLCAHPDTEPASWADFLAPFTAPLNATHHPLPSGLFCTGADFKVHPDTVLHDPGLLFVLLDLFAGNNTPLACTLHTPGAIQHRALIPRRISSLQGLLTVTDATTTLQIVLPALRHLAVHPSKIDLVGIDGTSLLTLSPAGDPPAARLWSAILDTALDRS
jgi:hypothetical protein